MSDFVLDSTRAWNTDTACAALQAVGLADSRRTAERRLHELGLLPGVLDVDALRDEFDRPPRTLVLRDAVARARAKRILVLFAQLHTDDHAQTWLHANDARGGRHWIALPAGTEPAAAALAALRQLQLALGKPVAVFAHGALVGLLRRAAPIDGVALQPEAYAPVLCEPEPRPRRARSRSAHLHRLEAESIHILREAVAEAERPVMLYSIGKDSSVMLHLARKAFYPASPPLPLLHVDTRWKFQEMYLFRDWMARTSGMDLQVHVNPEAIARDISPLRHGSALHTQITKTEGLKQALDQGRFDVVFGGARRDEEKSRAKERIFSFRNAHHVWDPKNQRPELWNLYNTRKAAGESIRVFPLSNWTELDIWQYIDQEDIPVVPLYFAKERPVVRRDGMLLMVDDDRFELLPGEAIEYRTVRFRTLGCYPLTGAVESTATTVAEIVLELLRTRSSERQGRLIDADSSGSMEKKKREGYF
jgi:sulfate adenylyltransferase subunit 2